MKLIKLKPEEIEEKIDEYIKNETKFLVRNEKDDYDIVSFIYDEDYIEDGIKEPLVFLKVKYSLKDFITMSVGKMLSFISSKKKMMISKLYLKCVDTTI